MSLSFKQKADTRKELQENLRRSGFEVSQIAAALQTTEKYIEDLLVLKPRRSDDIWILRNLLVKVLLEKDVELVPFTALKGGWTVSFSSVF